MSDGVNATGGGGGFFSYFGIGTNTNQSPKKKPPVYQSPERKPPVQPLTSLGPPHHTDKEETDNESDVGGLAGTDTDRFETAGSGDETDGGRTEKGASWLKAAKSRAAHNLRQIREGVRKVAEETLDLTPGIEEQGASADLRGRISELGVWVIDELRRDYLPSEGFGGLAREMSQWVDYLANQLAQTFPSVKNWFKETSRPAQDTPTIPSDLGISVYSPPPSLVMEGMIGRATGTCSRILCGDRPQNPTEEQVENTIRNILRMGVSQGERRESIKNLMDQPHRFQHLFTRVLTTLENLTKRVDADFVNKVVARLVDAAIVSNPLQAIRTVEKNRGTSGQVELRRREVLGEINHRHIQSQESVAGPLHPVIAANIVADPKTHELLARRHIEQLLLRLFYALLADQHQDPVALRLQRNWVEKELFQQAAHFLAIELFSQLGQILSAHNVEPTLSKLINDTRVGIAQAVPFQGKGKRAQKIPPRPSQTPFLAVVVQEKINRILIPQLAQQLFNGGGFANWGIGKLTQVLENTITASINAGLGQYLEPVGASGQQSRIRSAAVLEKLKRVERKMQATHLGLPQSQEPEETQEPSNNVADRVVELLDLEGIKTDILRWLGEYRLVFDNIVFKAVDAVLLEIVPELREQGLIDCLERPVEVNSQICVDFAQHFIPNEQKATPCVRRLLWGGHGNLRTELTRDEVWTELLGELSDGTDLKRELENLQKLAREEIKHTACVELKALLTLAGERFAVEQALNLPTYQGIRADLSQTLKTHLDKVDGSLAAALIAWRSEKEPISAVELVKRAHEHILIQEIEKGMSRERAIEHLGDITKYFYKNRADFQEAINRAREALRG